MSEFDIRCQLAEGLERIEQRLIRIERYQTFLMLCVVFWSIANMLSSKVDNFVDFAEFMVGIVIVGIGGFVVWHIRYWKQPNEKPSERT